ncbi:hypothetical protein JQM60_10950 [Butyricicoccus pullicaecorum]|nr:hypothetical protein [Butyricicoccus pullicaecorum]
MVSNIHSIILCCAVYLNGCNRLDLKGNKGGCIIRRQIHISNGNIDTDFDFNDIFRSGIRYASSSDNRLLFFCLQRVGNAGDRRLMNDFFNLGLVIR